MTLQKQHSRPAVAAAAGTIKQNGAGIGASTTRASFWWLPPRCYGAGVCGHAQRRRPTQSIVSRQKRRQPDASTADGKANLLYRWFVTDEEMDRPEENRLLEPWRSIFRTAEATST